MITFTRIKWWPSTSPQLFFHLKILITWHLCAKRGLKWWLLVIGEENTLFFRKHFTTCTALHFKHGLSNTNPLTMWSIKTNQSVNHIQKNSQFYSWHCNDRQAGASRINNHLSQKQILFNKKCLVLSEMNFDL